jgi:hypothetical protein
MHIFYRGPFVSGSSHLSRFALNEILCSMVEQKK